jgi:hypothetical protein
MEKPDDEFRVQDYRARDVFSDEHLIALGRVVAEFGILEAAIKGSCVHIYFHVVGLSGQEF